MSAAMYYCWLESPLGKLFVQSDGQFLTGLYLPEHKGWRGPAEGWEETAAPFAVVRKQLTEYFTGQRSEFDLPLKLVGTPFQQQVWRELVRIPYGETITYAELAQRVGKPSAARAVGHANGRNPVSIIVPCHRVVGTSGKLTGYAGGIEKKEWLLAREQNTHAGQQKPLPKQKSGRALAGV